MVGDDGDDGDTICVEVVDDSRWSAVEELFGRAGADNGCWCQYWLLGADYTRRPRQDNRSDLRRQAGARRAGLLAHRDGAVVGWARLSPRRDLPYLTRRFHLATDAATTEDGVWSLPCFFVASRTRGQGVMRALIAHAVTWARDQDVTLEAYPVDPSAPNATRNRFSGVLPAFLAEGFEPVGVLTKDRVLVRIEPVLT